MGCGNTTTKQTVMLLHTESFHLANPAHVPQVIDMKTTEIYHTRQGQQPRILSRLFTVKEESPLAEESYRIPRCQLLMPKASINLNT